MAEKETKTDKVEETPEPTKMHKFLVATAPVLTNVVLGIVSAVLIDQVSKKVTQMLDHPTDH